MKQNTYDRAVIGERIQLLRTIKGYSREAFAEQVGISPKFLYEIEKGNKGFSSKILLQISNALSVTCDCIISGTISENCDKEVLEIFEDGTNSSLSK
ncbi:MAG: helix-turn-helix transcriptional regulator [Ruminococcaceae bacterium]|nr:helix-turn-helix transcriptional regulator [Oscillospiraceae bacterium]